LFPDLPGGTGRGAGIPEKQSRKGLKIATAAVLLVAAAAGIYWWAMRPVALHYTTARLDRGDVVATVTTTGSCNAVVTVQVGSQVSGNILAIYADFNTKVKKGQLVARIDPAIFQARVDQLRATQQAAEAAVVTARANVKRADADIASAEANVASQRSNLVRAQSAVEDARLKNDRRIALVQQGIIAQEDADTAKATYDQALAALEAEKSALTASLSNVESAKAQREVASTQVASAQAQVTQATASLKQAQLDLAHTQIIAPVDGTVISRNMDVGQTVAASFQAPTIFQIAQDLTKMQVDTNVDESDMAPIRVGQTAQFTVDAYPNDVFQGTVTQIRQSPIKVQNVVTYDVVIEVDNTSLKLFPGMTANVKLATGRVSNAVRLPLAALRYRPAVGTTATSGTGATGTAKGRAGAGSGSGTRGGVGGRPQTVYVLENNVATAKRVGLGLSDGNFAEVRSGLNEGDTVILSQVADKASATKPTTPASTPGTTPAATAGRGRGMF
jgi:HlyD family secretion protein